jgi:carbamoyl-phosphate synthase large subunit
VTSVLISAVGRQGPLVRAFRRAAEGQCGVLAMDLDPWAPGLTEADQALAGRSPLEPEYGAWLVECCAFLRVGLLLTLNEGELAAMEGVREALLAGGTRLVGSPAVSVGTYVDKWVLASELSKRAIPTPRTWLGNDPGLMEELDGSPLIAKPRRGRGSDGILMLEGLDAVRTFAARRDARQFIVQPVIRGVEYGMDVVHDLLQTPQTVLMRQKLRMARGETDRARSVALPELESLGVALGAWTRHQGVFDVDVIMPYDGPPMVIDVNPRFGGGHAFSAAAGAQVPAAILHWFLHPGVPLPEPWLDCRVDVTAQRITEVVQVPADLDAPAALS